MQRATVSPLSMLSVLLIGSLSLIGCGSDSDTDLDLSGLQAECEANNPAEPCEVLRLVNQERVDAGLSPYSWDSALAYAAQAHAVDMVQNDYFSHESLDGRSFSDRADEAGYTGFASGENIAKGQTSPEDAMNSWMNSSGHRDNILSPNSNEIGVGFHQNVWVQVFGKR